MQILKNSIAVPSILGKRRKRDLASKPAKIVSWDREVIHLPCCYMELFDYNGVVPILCKQKDALASC